MFVCVFATMYWWNKMNIIKRWNKKDANNFATAPARAISIASVNRVRSAAMQPRWRYRTRAVVAHTVGWLTARADADAEERCDVDALCTQRPRCSISNRGSDVGWTVQTAERRDPDRTQAYRTGISQNRRSWQSLGRPVVTWLFHIAIRKWLQCYNPSRKPIQAIVNHCRNNVRKNFFLWAHH